MGKFTREIGLMENNMERGCIKITKALNRKENGVKGRGFYRKMMGWVQLGMNERYQI